MKRSSSFFNKLSVVKEIAIFEDLNWFTLNRIARLAEFVECSKGDVICQQGTPADAFYALVSGRVHSYTVSGKQLKEDPDYLVKGMHFGLISTLTGENHSHTYQAVNDSVVLRINKDDFAQLLRVSPKLALALNRSLSQKLRSQSVGVRGSNENQVIAVYAPVNEAGSSTYAANLALTLKSQSEDKKILLVNLTAEKTSPLRSLSEVVHDQDSIFTAGREDKLPIDVLGFKFDSQDQEVLHRIGKFVSSFIKDYHYVIFDLPGALDDAVMEFLIHSDIVHILSRPLKQDLESTSEVISRLSRELKGDFRPEKVRVIISGVMRANGLRPEKVRKLLNYDVFLTMPHAKPSELKQEEVFKGLSINWADPQSDYAFILQRVSRQLNGSLIGLVLGGGAALGMAHVGVIRVLEREKIPVDVIVGSSMGALIGSLWAMGHTADEMEDFGKEFSSFSGMLKIFDPPLQRSLIFLVISILFFIFKMYLWAFFFMFLIIPLALLPVSGVVRGLAIKRWLKEKLGASTFHHTKMQLKIVAYDLFHRKDIVIDYGSLVDAVSKSIAIPGIIPPVMEGGQMVIDGGVINPLPTNVLVEMGVKKIIAVNVLQSPEEVSWAREKEVARLKRQAKVSFKKYPLKYISFHFGALGARLFTPNIADIIVRTLLASEYVFAEISGKKANVLIHPDLRGVEWFELYEISKLVRRGQDAAMVHLPAIKDLVNHGRP